MSTYCAWLLGGSDVTTSQNTGGARLPDGRAAASACRRGAPWSLWWLPASSGCTARRWGATGRGWGGTSGRWGLRAVDTTLGQWIPTLVEQVDSGPLLTGPASNHDHRAQAQATGRGRWGRTCDGGAGLCRKNLGLTPARSGVHSADISQPGVSALSGDRWNSAVSSPVCSPDSG